jgi:hypothetical protein
MIRTSKTGNWATERGDSQLICSPASKNEEAAN